MNPEEALFFKIDDWLHGRLSPEETRQFEADMAADPALAARAERQRRENRALERLVDRQLRLDVAAWEREAPPVIVPLNGRRRVWRLAGLAAAALALLTTGWWFFRQNDAPADSPVAVETPPTVAPKPDPKTPAQRRTPSRTPSDPVARTPQPATPGPQPAPAPKQKTPDYPALAEAFYRERDFFPAAAPSTGKTPSTGSSYDRALRNFQDGRYTDVLPQLKPSANDLNVRELTAHTLFKNGRYDEAIAALQQLVNLRKAPYSERAEWALVLAALHQMPRRQILLNRTLESILSKPDHAFYAKAKALKEQL